MNLPNYPVGEEKRTYVHLQLAVSIVLCLHRRCSKRFAGLNLKTDLKTDFLSTGLSQELAPLSRRSNLPGFVWLTGHVLLLLVTGIGVHYAVLQSYGLTDAFASVTSNSTHFLPAVGELLLHSLMLIGALVVHGIVLNFLFSPLHETIHYTAFRSRWINSAVAKLLGFLVLLPPRFFRQFHFSHHRHTHDPAKDPEITSRKPATKLGLLWYLTGIPTLARNIAFIVCHACCHVTEGFISRRMRKRIINEARLYLITYCAIGLFGVLFGAWWVLWYWLIPLVVGQPALRIFLLAEHTDLPFTASPVRADMLKNSRCMKTIWPIRFLSWNMTYHMEHHAYASVPFHRLSQLHEVMSSHVIPSLTAAPADSASASSDCASRFTSRTCRLDRERIEHASHRTTRGYGRVLRQMFARRPLV